jgi:hypothetical protein
MKNINWKDLLINNCEKVLFGLIGLFVLASVATAKWGTYERMPQEFTDAVAKGKKNFAVSQWTEEKQAEFAAVNVGDKVNLVMTKPAAREYSTRWVWPMNKKKEKIKEPEYRLLLEPVADAGRVLMDVAEKTSGTNGITVVQATPEEVKAAEIKASGPDLVAPPRNLVDAPRDAGGNTAAPTAPTQGTVVSGNNLASGQAGNRNAEGRYFVAFRAVFPMKEQVDKIRQALNLETNAEALRLVEFWDFKLERQTARAGADPWAGPWEKVDIGYALSLLERVEFDIDVVSDEYRDSAITMPLPYRITSDWKRAVGPTGRKLASHPRINKMLSAKEAEVQEAKMKALIDATKKDVESQKVKKGGFGGVQYDSKTMQNAVRGNAGMQNMFNTSFSAQMGLDEGEGNDPSRGAMNPASAMGMNTQQGNAAQVTQISDLLLFRFLDFQIVPGNAYRYRARLVLTNPNFQRDASELLDVTSREGQFRETEWSAPSTPAMVQDNVEFYVDKLKASKNETTASIDVYQWMKETGSYVQGHFENLRPGDRIAAWKSGAPVKRSSRKKRVSGMDTLVLRPLEQTYAKEKIDYVTPNTLVDVEQTKLIDPKAYPELNLTPKKLQLTMDTIVMLNRFGELETKDNANQAGKYGAAQNLMARQEKLWSSLREKASTASTTVSAVDSLLSGGGGVDGMDDSAAMMGMEGMTGRKSSSGKRGGGGSGNGMPGESGPPSY